MRTSDGPDLVVTIGEIWTEVLGDEEPLDIDVNFFDAGGDSLRLLRMQQLLRERLHADVRGVDLFEHTTIRQLAAFLGKAA
jgi:aryl carrier-like protein